MKTIPKFKSGQYRVRASGTLPNGAPVVLNTDGTVSAVSGETQDQSTGSPATFSSDSTFSFTSVYHSAAQKIVTTYVNPSTNYLTAVVGTVSGTSISFGTPVVVQSVAVSPLNSVNTIVYHESAQKVVCTYIRGSDGYLQAIVGTVSGTSISFGSPVSVNSGATSYRYSTSYDPSSQQIICGYRSYSSNFLFRYYGTAVLLTVSGTSITVSSAYKFSAGLIYQSGGIHIAYSPDAGKHLIVYGNDSSSDRFESLTATVSGGSLSFGSVALISTSRTYGYPGCVAYDSGNGKFIVAHENTSGNINITAVTLSGTDVVVGDTITPVTSAPLQTAFTLAYNPYSNATALVYVIKPSTYATVRIGTVSAGGSLLFTSDDSAVPSLEDTYTAIDMGPIFAYDPVSTNNFGMFTGYPSPGVTHIFALRPFRLSTNLDGEKYIGISTGGTAANGASVTIDVVGSVNDEQSGLTPDEEYYIGYTGALTLDSASGVIAGTAISATEIRVKD